jgi:hypothetical protein
MEYQSRDVLPPTARSVQVAPESTDVQMAPPDTTAASFCDTQRVWSNGGRDWPSGSSAIPSAALLASMKASAAGACGSA